MQPLVVTIIYSGKTAYQGVADRSRTPGVSTSSCSPPNTQLHNPAINSPNVGIIPAIMEGSKSNAVISDVTTQTAARKKARDDFVMDQKLSLVSQHGVPSLLLSAPTAISLLGSLRLLAYSPDALRVSLHLRSDTLLRFTRLPPAIEQLALEARGAFALAEKNMYALVLGGNTMFGRGGNTEEILNILMSPKYAESALDPALADLESRILDCKNQTGAIIEVFTHIQKLCDELHLVMAEEASLTEHKTRIAEKEKQEAERSKTREEQRKVNLKDELDRLREEYKTNTRSLGKLEHNSEWKLLGLRAASNLESGFTGIINAAIGAPRLAMQGVEALSRIRRPAEELLTADRSSRQATAGPSQSVPYSEAYIFNKAFEKADAIARSTATLAAILERDLRQLLRDKGTKELRECVESLEDLEQDLGGHKGKYVANALATIERARKTGRDILQSESLAEKVGEATSEWDDQVKRWRRELEIAAQEAVELQAAASSQPGRGFGNRLIRLHIQREAMQKSRDDLRITMEKADENAIRAAALAQDIERLTTDGTNFASMVNVLKGAIELIAGFGSQVEQLNTHFGEMAEVIRAVYVSQPKMTRAIRSGVDRAGAEYRLSYDQAQANVIRNTLSQLRARFMLVVDDARLYHEISRDHISPCMREVCLLPMNRQSEQQETDAKKSLQARTEKAKYSIKAMIEKRGQRYHEEMASRLSEIEEETAQLTLPMGQSVPDNLLQSIREGVASVDMGSSTGMADVSEPERDVEDDL
ncbi:hypothetical protein Q7P37_010957 [Cladosporium fusiforme]